MSKNLYLLFCALSAALGGLLFGFDTAVISGAEKTLLTLFRPQYESLAIRFFGSVNFWHGFTVAAALIGTTLGAIIAGRFADKHGRRAVLRLLGVLFVGSAIGSALAWGMWSFFWFRLIAGLAVGGASVVAPMYIAEISPARMRGRLVAVTQFNIVSGILLAFVSNYIIAGMGLGENAWRWMFGVAAFPSVVFWMLLYFVPRSPRWLMARGLKDEAAAALGRLGTDSGSVEEEIAAIQASLDKDHHQKGEALFQKKYLRPILLAWAIAMFNQLSGINALMYFAPRIFEMAGFESSAAMLSSVGVGAVNLVFTMAALVIIDHFGRRKLMLVGSVGYIISLTACAWAFYRYGTHFSGAGSQVVLWSLLLFIASHAFGQGAVILAFISEIFPNRLRGRGQAFGLTTHWVMACAISWTFPMFAESSGGNTFAFYALCMVGQLVWVIVSMPETKGIPLEEMEKKLGIVH